MSFKKTLWISHSAISAYERCPHLYYLEYQYRNPETGNRIQITNPYLALGSAVHETIEGLLDVPIKERTKISLEERFHKIFEDYRGTKGGFLSQKKEKDFYERGVKMVKRVEESLFLNRLSIKMKAKLPSMNLLGDDVKLVGSIDWIEKLEDGSAHIIDFKTGKSKENGDSLQLPIYVILAKNNISEKVEKVSYWYLESDEEPVEQEIKNVEESLALLKEKAAIIKKAVEENNFPCNYPSGCFACKDYEKIFNGEAEKIKTENNHQKDVFCIFKEKDVIEKVLEEDFLDEREKKIFELRMEKPIEAVNKELLLTEEKSEKIVLGIKEKLKNNLRKKELKIIINLLKK
jgi:hypothetical protein